MPYPQPYRTESINTIYDLLFCDNLELFKTNNSSLNNYPWSVIFSPTADDASLNKIIDDETLDARTKLLAYTKLNQKDPATKDLLGVIIEVGLDEGLDVLAAYNDGTARYINYSEKIIIWETPNEISNELVEELFVASENVVRQIGPWTEPRLPFPPKGNVRLSFLVSDGLYFGQGPFEVLLNDPMGGPVIEAATNLMQYLTQVA